MGEALLSYNRALEMGKVSNLYVMYDYMISAKKSLGMLRGADKDCLTAIRCIFSGWGFQVDKDDAGIINLVEVCFDPVRPTEKQNTIEYDYLKHFYKSLMEIREKNIVEVDFYGNKDKEVEDPEGEVISFEERKKC